MGRLNVLLAPRNYFTLAAMGPSVSGTRAQSEVVGMILLVAVTIVTATVIGGSFVTQADDAGPLTELSVQVTTQTVTVTHTAGEPVPIDELTLIVHNQSGSWRRPFTAGTPSSGRFDSGDTWTIGSPFPSDERVTVYVVHTPTNRLLFEGRRIVS